MTKDEIIAELKELGLNDVQFEKALERRLAQQAPQKKDDDEPEDYCTACVL